MYISARLLALPTSLLTLIVLTPTAVISQELQWPYKLPAHVKYYPEDEVSVKRDMGIQQKLQQLSPTGVRKMSEDAGEKFFMDYWLFEDGPWSDAHGDLGVNGSWASAVRANGTFSASLSPPFPIHLLEESSNNAIFLRYVPFRFAARSTLGKRDFQCPAGTSSCTSINRPNSCCAQGQTCQLIQDTGLGDVGCCADIETCANTVSSCADGYNSCPSYPGGGCCIPGYMCVSYGCAIRSTSTIVVVPSPTSTSTQSLSSEVSIPAFTSSSLIGAPLASTSTLPLTSTSTSSPTTSIESTSSSSSSNTVTTTTTTTSSTSTVASDIPCSTGYKSCPASLGGGCCPTDRGCARDACPALSSTASIDAPVRPTSDPSISFAPTTTTGLGCPTGFYACSAYYQGGCCQVGRDCAKTSCPTSASTTLLNTDGITAVAPTRSGITAGSILTGACATGWSSCAVSDGGGCCPNGYACGSTCTATVGGVQSSQVAKIAPSAALGRNVEERLYWTIIAVAAAACFFPFL